MEIIAQRKSTIRDVAKQANTSVTTVSLILNGKGERFSAATKAKVLAAKESLGYHPDYYARGLIGQRMNSIGVVIPDIMNPFFASFVISVEKAAIPRGFFPQVFSINGFHENIDNFIEQFDGGTQKGLILAASGASQEIVSRLNATLPLVFTDQANINGLGDQVSIEELAAGEMIASYLLKLGHRRIAIILPETLTLNLEKRFTGYQNAFTKHHVPFDDELVFRSSFDPAGGRQAVDRIVKTDATAIIAINDDVALGVYRGLRLHHKCVPEDYSVVGFDNVSRTHYMTPPLTTVAQPIDALGQAATDLILKRLDNPKRSRKAVSLDVLLKERESARRI